MPANEDGTLAKRRAIEALRNGVPNGDAVRQLGCKQQAIEDRFRELLADVAAGVEFPAHREGMLVSGDFGVGKSHLLAYLEHIALEEGFVCSRVAVSKETPLFDLSKVLKAAVDCAKVPGRAGRLIEELELSAKRDTEAFRRFFGWAASSSFGQSLHGVFQASLVAYVESKDPELKSGIEGFWAGDRIRVSLIKAGLREIGKREYTGFRAPRLTEIPPQRLRFLVEMIKGAGYGGWVILLDEIELVASYSILQRGPVLCGTGPVAEDFRQSRTCHRRHHHPGLRHESDQRARQAGLRQYPTKIAVAASVRVDRRGCDLRHGPAHGQLRALAEAYRRRGAGCHRDFAQAVQRGLRLGRSEPPPEGRGGVRPEPHAL